MTAYLRCVQLHANVSVVQWNKLRTGRAEPDRLCGCDEHTSMNEDKCEASLSGCLAVLPEAVDIRINITFTIREVYSLTGS